MEILLWLGQELATHWVILAITFAGSVLLGATRKYWSLATTPLLYGVVGVAVAVFLIGFQYPSDQQTEVLEQTGREQIEALERLASEQGKILQALTNANPIRPFFTQLQPAIREMSENLRYLTVSIQNNNVPVDQVVIHLLALDGFLDTNTPPLHSKREEYANPTGARGILSQHWWPVPIKRNSRPMFVVFQARYADAVSRETYSQQFFFKFGGTSQSGTFIEELFNATSDEKTEIERYMESRGISSL